MKGWNGVRLTVGVALLELCLTGGCDQAPAPVPPQATAPVAVAADAADKPTTQELMGGAYRRLNLPGMSLTIMVPQSWKIEMHTGGLTFLEGPTVADRAAIQLSVREALSKDRYLTLVEQLGKDDSGALEPGSVKKNEVREVGMMKMLERISTGKPMNVGRIGPRGMPEVDSAGNQISDVSTPMRWLLTIFVPEGPRIEHFELNFIGLTAEQYATDKPLLEKIIGSIQYDDGSLAPTPAISGL